VSVVRVTLELEVPSEQAAEAFRLIVADWSEKHGAYGNIRVGDTVSRECPQCGQRMVYDGTLAAYVCSHVEDQPA